MRLFVAVDLPDALADEIDAVQSRLPDAGLRFTDPRQAHLTLQFLGETDPDRLGAVEDAVGDAVAGAGVDPFEAEIGGLGVFPSLDYISVVWLGIREGAAAFARLNGAVESATAPLGFEPDDHEFTPHVTVARMDDARRKNEVRTLVRESDPTVGRFRVREVRLKRSTLTPDGPEYGTVAGFGL